MLVDIFNYYIMNGHITFDTEPTTLEERECWLSSYGTGRHQIIVAERSGQILGCSYSSPFRTHQAFATTVETSIYLDQRSALAVSERAYTRIS
jgi:phosphinothricin acetyltransferase